MDVPAGVTQEEGHTGFLIHLPSAVRALIFVARRIQPFLSLVDREVEFCKVVFFGLVTITLNARNNSKFNSIIDKIVHNMYSSGCSPSSRGVSHSSY